jgi:hypothetical protein
MEPFAKSYMTNGRLIYGEIFANLLLYSNRKPSSYMTWQLLHSEFPAISGKFDFLFYQCNTRNSGRHSLPFGPLKGVLKLNYLRDFSVFLSSPAVRPICLPENRCVLAH